MHDRSWAAGVTTAAAAAGHDLGNVLTAIYGHAELARQQLSADHPACEELDELVARAEQAHDLARRLSLLGRAGMPPVLLPDVAALLGELVAARRGRADAVVPRLEVRWDGPVAVEAPPTLREALDLLLDQEPEPPDGGPVDLTLDRGGDEACITVRSPGAAPDHEPWRGGSLGLALTVVQVGALTAGGRFRVTPEPEGRRLVEVGLPARTT